MNPEHAAAARQAARDAGKQVGQWLEEAITEKREREQGAEDVTKADCAKELGISPAYLSYMLNGKRPWRKDLYQRYMGVVNTFVNSGAGSEDTQAKRPPQQVASLGSEKGGAGRGTRTHTSVKIADFKSAASAIPPSRLCKLGLHRLNF